MLVIVSTALWAICTNKLILRSIDNREALHGPKFSLIYVGAILNIILALVMSWIIILVLITSTPREGFSLTATKVSMLLNVFVQCCSSLQHVVLLIYHFAVVPQLEATIVEKKILGVTSVIGAVMIVLLLVPAFYYDLTLQAVKFFVSLSTTVSMGLCFAMLFYREGIAFLLLVLYILSFAPLASALIFVDEVIMMSPSLALVLVIMSRCSHIFMSPFKPLALERSLRDAVYEDAVELSVRLTPRLFNNRHHDEHNVRFDVENQELGFGDINNLNNNHDN